MPIPTSLQPYADIFSNASLRFAGQLQQEQLTSETEDDHAVLLAAALVCEAQQQGNICIELSNINAVAVEELPSVAQWREALRRSSVVSDSNNAPLVLEGTRLYLGRYWYYEQWVAQRLSELAAYEFDLPSFPVSSELDWQQVAVAIALRKRLAIISGGPGTGKTTTLVSILAALKKAQPSLDIAMAAPTGKAAGRMREAIQNAMHRLPADTQALIPDNAVTLHRLLGVRHRSAYFKQSHRTPLRADIVVIDEASMVDLAMMAKLLAALKPTARLILLGDRDQLASVEAGSVLGDICSLQGAQARYSPEQLNWLAKLGLPMAVDEHSGSPPNSLADCIVILQKSYRFSATSGIGALARAVNQGDANAALAVLNSDREGVRWSPQSSVSELLQEPMAGHWRRVMGSSSAHQALLVMDELRVLTALRSGPRGVEQVNAIVELFLRRAGILPAETVEEFYAGQPLMITRNDSVSGLANGDTGIIWPADDNSLRFYYRSGGEVHSLATARLPENETVFAMTVHKSQGSEFDEVLLLMPDTPSPVATRELLYTAITRAKKRVSIAASSPVLEAAMAATVQRSSGLAERLKND